MMRKEAGDRGPWAIPLAVALLLVPFTDRMQAALFSSQAATTGDWSQAATWTNNAVPGIGDDVEITNAGSVVVLSSSSASLNSLLLRRTLLFTNWNTTLNATTVTIVSNGLMTLPPAFTDAGISNNIVIACSTLTIASGGKIDVDARGYAHGTLIADGQGPGGGSTGENGGGASYGGRGGAGAGANGLYGVVYGAENEPTDPGSGGGGSTYSAGTLGAAGGGAVRILASGVVTVNGAITANGGTRGVRGAGGSGGGIFITCLVIAGTNGTISANGGGTAGYGGGGGGGRIAVSYNPSAQTILPKPSITFSARLGGSSNGGSGDIGTLSFPDNALLDAAWLPHQGQLIIPGFRSWSVGTLVATGHLRLPSSPSFQLTVTQDMIVRGAGSVFWLRNGTIDCGGNLVVSNGGSLYVGPYSGYDVLSGTHVDLYSALTNLQSIRGNGNLVISNTSAVFLYAAMTNGAQTNAYGALLDIAGDVSIGSGSKLVPGSDRTNGASTLLRMRDLRIDTGGQISADAAGYAGAMATYSAGYGPGRGAKPAINRNGGGGGHGGVGGDEYTVSGYGGPTYGASNAPVEPGSGGSSGTSFFNGFGGGLVRVEARRNVIVAGTISANGGSSAGRIGGGSGGGIHIRCRSFSGTTGAVLRANGGAAAGDSYSGGGGGGRIAVWRTFDSSDGPVTTSVNGGSGHTKAGSPGRVFWGHLSTPGTIIVIK